MKNKNGFTLTEILLAVMIVGLIGVALASLTTAASRESGVGRSKVLLRNNLSSALRTLRGDVDNARLISFVSGAAVPLNGPVLKLELNRIDATTPANRFVTYCFKAGTGNKNREGGDILPSGATIGGVLTRLEAASDYPSCSSGSSRRVLDNVKYIASGDYPVPLFCLGNNCASGSARAGSGILTVRLITELYSRPVVNDAVEEIFVAPGGF